MALSDLSAKVPLIGMSMVFAAMGIVAVTAYLHVGWYSIAGYALAAIVAVFGFAFTFRDLSDPPDPRPVSQPPGAESDGPVHN
jgi:hypothetical protein